MPTPQQDRPIPRSGRKQSETATRPDQDPLLTVQELAKLWRLDSVRFPRRLIAERRIRFVKVGRYVRIPMPAVTEFMTTYEPMTTDQIRKAA